MLLTFQNICFKLYCLALKLWIVFYQIRNRHHQMFVDVYSSLFSAIIIDILYTVFFCRKACLDCSNLMIQFIIESLRLYITLSRFALVHVEDAKPEVAIWTLCNYSLSQSVFIYNSFKIICFEAVLKCSKDIPDHLNISGNVLYKCYRNLNIQYL